MRIVLVLQGDGVPRSEYDNEHKLSRLLRKHCGKVLPDFDLLLCAICKPVLTEQQIVRRVCRSESCEERRTYRSYIMQRDKEPDPEVRTVSEVDQESGLSIGVMDGWAAWQP